MARDEMYVDTSISDPIGDYVAVGTRNQGCDQLLRPQER